MRIEMTPRWTSLRFHKEQQRLWESPARFKVVPAGRRSGKTEICKRTGIIAAIGGLRSGDGRYVFAAPTHDQAVKIFWDDVCRLVPKAMIRGSPKVGTHTIELLNGSTIAVFGLDRPQRLEGSPVDWIAIDEMADIRQGAWEKHVRPALDTDGRPGSAFLLGVPGGRNHYYRLYEKALAEKAAHGEASDWDVFHWKSAEILDPAVIAQARRDLDELTFQQEYEASFISFNGRAYYPFARTKHAAVTLSYRPRLPLIFCFDFNVEPGVAAVAQEQIFETPPAPSVPVQEDITCCIGEVWIPRNSNTPAVCRKLIADWGPGGLRGEHHGDVLIYGDATGGNRGSAKLNGSDWDLIKDLFRSVPGWSVHYRVGTHNPPERSRVNAVNSRLEAATGATRLLIDPQRCPRGIEDFEGVALLEGGSGEIEKNWNKSPDRTHWTDAVGYYIAAKHPLVRKGVTTMTIF